MFSHPCSDTGRLQSDLSNLECTVRDKAESYEVSSLRSDVDRMEYTVRELSAEVVQLRYELQRVEGGGEQVLERLEAIEEKE